MVAELESSTYRRSFKFPSTPTRWNLKERNAFPQWHSDLRRVVRYATAPGFLGSPPPALAWGDEAAPRARTSARSKATARATHAHAHAATFSQDECWLRYNVLLYDIILASVTLTEAQLVHVENGLGSVADGNALYAWVLTHADDNKLSVQLQLKEALRKLTIADTYGILRLNSAAIIGLMTYSSRYVWSASMFDCAVRSFSTKLRQLRVFPNADSFQWKRHGDCGSVFSRKLCPRNDGSGVFALQRNVTRWVCG
ncbi:hypothetical protein AB1Y20_001538 [Prymnesium parvum]|uniref:Uncharacterized protein n=1 Tax=Prymnesium parvum TaxID=97485 RepID=A0AB34KBZ0_PRYPA